MGNMPSQRPLEGEDAAADAPDGAPTVFGRVTRATRSLVADVRRRVSVFPDLDLAAAFRIGDDGDQPRRPPDDRSASSANLPATSDAALPARERPFTSPARSGTANPPDLATTEKDGRLSVYYPDRDGAVITSDTYERVRR